MTIKSEQVNELAKALALAQAEMHDAKKDKKANYGWYATLSSVRQALNGPLTKHGLSIVQTFGADERGDYLETVLLHSSGQSIESKIYLKLDKPSMQSLGSAITYARRYALTSIVNVVADEDDDGALAEKSAPAIQSPPKQKITPVNDQATALSIRQRIVDLQSMLQDKELAQKVEESLKKAGDTVESLSKLEAWLRDKIKIGATK